MKNLHITRAQAIILLGEYNSDTKDHIHYLESEAVMRALAENLGEDVDYWGMLGLLHDIDWGLTKHAPQTHITRAPAILARAGFSQAFIDTISSHTYGFDCADNIHKKRTKKIEHALAASETITGLIHAYALMRGGNISEMQVKGLKKKFKDKTFAASVNREIIREIEHLGLSLDEFFSIAIEGMKTIKGEVGLS